MYENLKPTKKELTDFKYLFLQKGFKLKQCNAQCTEKTGISLAASDSCLLDSTRVKYEPAHACVVKNQIQRVEF